MNKQPNLNDLKEIIDNPEFKATYQKMHTPWINKYKNIRPNDPCPCGSGKKFKKCCMYKLNDMEKYLKG